MMKYEKGEPSGIFSLLSRKINFIQKMLDNPMSLCYNTKCSVRNRKQNADVVEWQTRYLEVVVSYARVGSSPVICTICGYGGIGRHA